MLHDMCTDDPKEFWRRIKMLRPRKPDESFINFNNISSDTQLTETLKNGKMIMSHYLKIEEYIRVVMSSVLTMSF